MARTLTVAAGQLGPIQMVEPRESAVGRMVRLLERAHGRGVQLVVFPELALTTFFPRHYREDVRETDHWFEAAMPSAETAPLFEMAQRRGIGFHLGYAERTPEGRRFNTAILVGPEGDILLKYRKVHLPGHAEYDPKRRAQHLEKRYFEVGDTDQARRAVVALPRTGHVPRRRRERGHCSQALVTASSNSTALSGVADEKASSSAARALCVCW